MFPVAINDFCKVENVGDSVNIVLIDKASPGKNLNLCKSIL